MGQCEIQVHFRMIRQELLIELSLVRRELVGDDTDLLPMLARDHFSSHGG